MLPGRPGTTGPLPEDGRGFFLQGASGAFFCCRDPGPSVWAFEFTDTAQKVRDALKGKANESNLSQPVQNAADQHKRGSRPSRHPASQPRSRPRAAICSAGRSRPLSISRRTLSAKGFLVSQSKPAIRTTAPKASNDVRLYLPRVPFFLASYAISQTRSARTIVPAPTTRSK